MHLVNDEPSVRPAAAPLDESFPAVLAAARQGAGWAWSRLYAEFAPGILGYLRARSAPDPENLLGEVFLQVVRDLRRFSGEGDAFRAWIFTIAHHRLMDDVRARARRPRATVRVEAVPDPMAGDVEIEAVRKMTEDAIGALLATLTDDQRAVLLLRIIGGLTVLEVADVLGKAEGAVKALQRRGLKTVSKKIRRGGTPFSPQGA